MIDTHCHLTFPGLHERVDEVVAHARAAGVDRMICVGTSPADARAAIDLAERFDGVYATAGFHPHYVAEAEEGIDALEPLLARSRVVALGEMGLDWHYDHPPAEQRRAFDAQLAVAARSSLPVIIHNREATDDVLAAIANAGVPGERFVFHCFAGGPEEIERILDAGAMVSFTGIVTFKNAAEVAEASDRVPLERLMVETDSPFLAPAPHRKVKPNEPRLVPHVARFLAERRGMDESAFAEAVDANAERFFRLNPDA